MSDEEEKPEVPPPPPPPPEEPASYEAEGYTPEVDAVEEEYIADSTGPAVASSANKNLVLMLVGGVLGLFLLYQIFSGDEEPVVEAPVPEMGPAGQGAAVAGDEGSPIEIPDFQPLPPPPPIVQPPAEPAKLPEPPPIPDSPDIDFLGDGPSNERLQERRASPMMKFGGSGGGATAEDETDDRRTSAPRSVATEVGDLDQLILQGKIIHGAIETAIDTTLAGPLRAIVTRDIYAESGYGVLVPKGSRLIGTYSTDVVRGQGRVYIIWSRLIRPDGIDIQLGDAIGVDRLGRAGMGGHVDERYFEIFGSAILTSILGIAIAGAADAVLDPDLAGSQDSSESTAGEEGNTVSSESSDSEGSAVNTAITESVENIGAVSTQVVGGLLDARPSITVDQGTPIKIFVNQDLEFPDSANKNIRIIQ